MAPPNIRVEYVCARTGKVLGHDDFYDPGFWLTHKNDVFMWPMYGCGHAIAPPPEPRRR